MENKNSILMPINQNFLEVFEVFMDENQKNKIRANNVRQYIEGIIDLLLKKIIQQHLKANEPYEGVNWSRKLKIIKENYDENIAEKFQEIFRIGGDGSHFNGSVSNQELQKIISQAIHIVEDIFVKYFLIPEHQFGSENIYTIFSMLPLNNRIYILENVYAHYKNQEIVDRLSLAYLKNGEVDKAREFLESAKEENIISSEFEKVQLYKLNVLANNLADLYQKNSCYTDNPEFSKAIVDGNLLVVGLPTSRDVFDTSKAVDIFRQWFEDGKSEYPEFINLFLCLMATDTRQYI
jgi:hypothetical protein